MRAKFNLKAIVSLVLSLVMVFAVTGCFNSSKGNGNLTVIRMVVGDNAYGKDLLEDQASRFAILHEKDSYAPGKEGVKIEVEFSGSALTINESILSEGYHIIATGDGYTKAFSAGQNGFVANLNDIMTTEIEGENKTIADKIPDSNKWSYYLDSKVDNLESGYYGLPYTEAYGGLTFDKDIFDTGFYFASAEEENVNTYISEILPGNIQYNFTDASGEKTLGPDGKPNTGDDGLPSSLYELIALCEYLTYEGIPPFLITSQPNFYINYFVEALYVSLLGYENGKALKDFDSDGVDVVVGYTDDELFPGEKGISGVKKPITQRVTIEEKDGYYLSHSLEKYYAFAFIQLAEQNEWFKDVVDAKTAQLNFLLGYHQTERRGAMLIENSYWVNESRIRGNFDNYKIIDGSKPAASRNPDREYRWMSLPVNISTMVDGTDVNVNTGLSIESKKGENPTLYIPDGGYYCVNARFSNDQEIMSAISDWFKFIYSDAELSWYTAKANYGYMLDYEIADVDYDNASAYTKHFIDTLRIANKVYPYGTSTVYKNNYSKLGKQGGSASYLFGGGDLGTTNVRAFLKQKASTGNPVLACFEDKIINISGWSGYFGSNAEVPEAQKYPVGHPKAGQDIKYEG